MTTEVKPNYHHGNLRQALMDGALHCIREHGAEHLSLRALARELGVSQAAPYRHFKDKIALLSALASDGFERLGKAMRHAFEQAGSDPESCLRQVGLTYVKFAMQHPETYRLMFGMKASDFNSKEMDAGHGEGFCVLEDVIRMGLEGKVFAPHASSDIATAAWCMVHGYASLLIDGVIDLDEQQAMLQFQGIEQVLNKGIVGKAS
ncbi:TetR/AcrR family transcriptional regulator [Neptunicella sp. SCSIO 80796]|uniref:TetR/AcrR family transcriptional regulator n=1 Tax=Neptunicella plasticusilytica TaxID=3117012 RepID=UPI003A4E0A4E